ncbi:hypothetical protein DR950_17770 [Kitasatospora xanthocidica]|uniref:Uncharacterized protein n=1 Tax=Kitasatospora xanthocidica TaxID=83382 RepID=A0A372ZVD5_9ACTN|nr:hypothetical protein [Kitasatospora xanthocidica]RGD59392.1 hypothetical protein DR950_17770 [Kitasatospora xanthocidica]
MGRAYQLELSDPTVTYFLDHFTHDRVVRAMDRLGMIQDLHYDLPFLTAALYDLERELMGADPQETVTAKKNAVSAASAPNPTGIPRYKVETGENWLITPAEITAALAARQRAPHGERAAVSALIDEWDPWIDFLHMAGDHAGLRSN